MFSQKTFISLASFLVDLNCAFVAIDTNDFAYKFIVTNTHLIPVFV